jgi:DNA modification methylase
MAKIEISKTELVWPGKYSEDGTLCKVPHVSLPFQVIERVNESRATREAKKSGIQTTLFEAYQGSEGHTFEDGWRNKLIWGDNLLVMGSLLANFAGKVNLVYIDPPFATGLDFSITTEIGEKRTEVRKEASMLEEKAYRDTWGRGIASYLSMMRDRLVLIRELLAETGVLYLHIGPDLAPAMRMLCDEVFGADSFLNEIIWKRTPFAGSSKARAKKFPVNHDSILFYGKRSEGYAFQHIYEEYSDEYKERFKHEDKRGFYRKTLLKTYSKTTEERLKAEDRWLEPTRPGAYPSYKQYLHESKGKQVEDIWGDEEDEINLGSGNVWEDLNLANPMADERTGYATQKPEILLKRILKASAKPGDLVADFFSGSATTLAVAESLGIRWIGCDIGRYAIHTGRKRLLEIEDCKPFEILNLGKYERQYWQGVTLGKGQTREHLFYEYLAFVLKLYNAQPLSGMSHLHGKKGRALVHIGTIDSPVTIDEVSQAVDECVNVKQPELHVLGWEWEMGLAGPNNGVKKGSPMHEVAKQRGIKLLLFQIPREVMEQQATDKGDVTFFELAYLNVEIKQSKKLQFSVKLNDFVIPNIELIPEDVREKVKKWSDYIDYWSVDWDFQDDTFMQGWVAYRTRKDRALYLESDPHKYDKPGTYRVLVKVVDIFGNDTSQAYRIDAK